MLEGDQKWARVSLRVWAASLPLDDMAGLLGLVPESIGRKGEPISERSPHARRDHDFWCWRVPADSSIPLEDQLTMALDAIEPKQAELERLLRESQGEADLFLGFSSANGQGGTSFSVDLLERLAALRISLLLDLYTPSLE